MIALLALASCVGSGDLDACPSTPYERRGGQAEDAAECLELGWCPFLCYESTTCEAADQMITCESCGDVEDYMNGPCADCYVELVDGAIGLACAGK